MCIYNFVFVLWFHIYESQINDQSNYNGTKKTRYLTDRKGIAEMSKNMNIIDRNQNVIGGSIDTEAAVLIDLNLDSNVENGKMGIADGADQLIFDMLTDISAKPGVYALREAYSNAYDATKKIGDMSLPIEINIPDHSAQTVCEPGTAAFADRLAAAIGTDNAEIDDARNVPMVTVTDHGCGMSADDLKSYFMMYGGSKKRGDYDMIGSKGLGCKAPIAVSPVFYVTTSKDGIECHATITRSDSGSNYNLVKSHTDKGNGTTISIPVLTDKVLADMNECVNTLIDFNYDANLIINGDNVGIGRAISKNMYDMGELDIAKTSDDSVVKMRVFIPDYEIPLNSVDGFVIVIGGYPYSIGNCNGFTTYYSDYIKNGRLTYNSRNNNYYGDRAILDVPIIIGEPGFLNFTPSRDEIKRDGACDTFSKAVSDAIVNCNWTTPVIEFINKAKNEYETKKNTQYYGDSIRLSNLYNAVFEGHSTRLCDICKFTSFSIIGESDNNYDCICNGIRVTIPKSTIDVAGRNPFPAISWGNESHLSDCDKDGNPDTSYLNDGKPHVTAISSVFNSGSNSRYRFIVNGSGYIKKKNVVLTKISSGIMKLPTIEQLGGLSDFVARNGNSIASNILWVVYGCGDDDFKRFFNRFADFESVATNTNASRMLTLAVYSGTPDDEFKEEIDFVKAYSFDDVRVLSVSELDSVLTEARSSRMKKREHIASINNGIVVTRFKISESDTYADLVKHGIRNIEKDCDFDSQLDKKTLSDNIIILADCGYSVENAICTSAVVSKLIPEYSATGVIVINGATKPIVTSLINDGAKIMFDVRRRVPTKAHTIADDLGIERLSTIPSTIIPDSEFEKLNGFLAHFCLSDTYDKTVAYNVKTNRIVYISRYSNTESCYPIKTIRDSPTLNMLSNSGNFPELERSFTEINDEVNGSVLLSMRTNSVTFDMRDDNRVKSKVRSIIKPAADIYDILYRNGLSEFPYPSYSNRKMSKTAKAAIVKMLTEFINENSDESINCEQNSDGIEHLVA